MPQFSQMGFLAASISESENVIKKKKKKNLPLSLFSSDSYPFISKEI